MATDSQNVIEISAYVIDRLPTIEGQHCSTCYRDDVPTHVIPTMPTTGYERVHAPGFLYVCERCLPAFRDGGMPFLSVHVIG